MKLELIPITLIIMSTIICQFLISNGDIIAYLPSFFNIFICIILFIYFTRKIFSNSKNDKLIKYGIFLIFILTIFFILPYQIVPFMFYLATIILINFDRKEKINTTKQFIKVTLPVFILLDFSGYFIYNIIYDLANFSIFEMVNAFTQIVILSVNLIIVNSLVIKKLKIKFNKLVIYFGIFIIVLLSLVTFDSVYKINSIINIQKKQCEIIKGNLDNINKKSELQSLIEKILEDCEIKENFDFVKSPKYGLKSIYQHMFDCDNYLLTVNLTNLKEKNINNTKKINNIKESVNSIYDIINSKIKYFGEIFIITIIITYLCNVIIILFTIKSIKKRYKKNS